VKRSDGRDGPGEKHEHCDYFVLDLTHDEHAKAAIIAYANDCAEKRPQLALDLRVRVGAVDLSEAKPAGELAKEEAEIRSTLSMGGLHPFGCQCDQCRRSYYSTPMGGHGDPQKPDDPRTASGEIPSRESRPRVEAAEIAGSTPASGATYDEAIEVWVGLDYDHLRRRGRFYGFTIGQFAIGITYFRKEAMGDG